MISCAEELIYTRFWPFEVEFLSFLHVFVCIGGPTHRDVATLGPLLFFCSPAPPPPPTALESSSGSFRRMPTTSSTPRKAAIQAIAARSALKLSHPNASENGASPPRPTSDYFGINTFG